MEWSPQRDRSDHRRLAVVLVIEGSDAAAAFETVRVGNRPVVHLGALLLAVVNHVEAGALLEPQRVQAGPALDLRLLLFAERGMVQQVKKFLVFRNRQSLAPGARL